MRFAIALALVACNGSSGSDAGNSADASTADTAAEQDAAIDTGLLQDSGGLITCVIPKGGAKCNGNSWQCDETDDCNTGACCLTIDAMKNITGSACMAFCNDPRLQLCNTMAECSGGMGCFQAPCSGYVVKTCGGVPAAQCK